MTLYIYDCVCVSDCVEFRCGNNYIYIVLKIGKMCVIIMRLLAGGTLKQYIIMGFNKPWTLTYIYICGSYTTHTYWKLKRTNYYSENKLILLLFNSLLIWSLRMKKKLLLFLINKFPNFYAPTNNSYLGWWWKVRFTLDRSNVHYFNQVFIMAVSAASWSHWLKNLVKFPKPTCLLDYI